MEMEWQTIDTAPKDEDILVSYLDNGKRQRAIARYQTDMYDGQEGWYEQIKNYTDYQGVRMHYQLPDGMSLILEIDFWMPLPEPPQSPQASVEPHWQAQTASMPHAAPVDAQDGGDYCRFHDRKEPCPRCSIYMKHRTADEIDGGDNFGG